MKQRSDLQQLNILEVGLGTGLNLMLTNKHCTDFSGKVLYHALEPFPLNAKLIDELEDFDMQTFELDSGLFRNISCAVSAPMPSSSSLRTPSMKGTDLLILPA